MYVYVFLCQIKAKHRGKRQKGIGWKGAIETLRERQQIWQGEEPSYLNKKGRTSATRIENTKTGEKVNKNQKIKRRGADSVDQGFTNPLTQNRSAIERRIREFSPFICQAVQALQRHHEIGNPIAGQRGKVSKLTHKQMQGLKLIPPTPSKKFCSLEVSRTFLMTVWTPKTAVSLVSMLVNKLETLNKLENLFVWGRGLITDKVILVLGMLGLGSQIFKSPIWGLTTDTGVWVRDWVMVGIPTSLRF